jgi:hypothetical protein
VDERVEHLGTDFELRRVTVDLSRHVRELKCLPLVGAEGDDLVNQRHVCVHRADDRVELHAAAGGVAPRDGRANVVEVRRTAAQPTPGPFEHLVVGGIERKADGVELLEHPVGEAGTVGDDGRLKADCPCVLEHRAEVGVEGRLADGERDARDVEAAELVEDAEPAGDRQRARPGGEGAVAVGAREVALRPDVDVDGLDRHGAERDCEGRARGGRCDSGDLRAGQRHLIRGRRASSGSRGRLVDEPANRFFPG